MSCEESDVVPMIAMYKPKKIKITQTHWTNENACPYSNTDNKIVINLRVVVIIVVITGVYQVIVKKINICPSAAAAFNINKLRIMGAYRRALPMTVVRKFPPLSNDEMYVTFSFLNSQSN